MHTGDTPPEKKHADRRFVALSREDRARQIEKRLKKVEELREKDEGDMGLLGEEAALRQELARLREEVAERAEAAARERTASQKRQEARSAHEGEKRQEDERIVIELTAENLEKFYIPDAARQLQEIHTEAEEGWKEIAQDIAGLSEEIKDDIFPTDGKHRIVEPTVDTVDAWLKQWKPERGGFTFSLAKIRERKQLAALREKAKAFARSPVMERLRKEQRRLANYQGELEKLRRGAPKKK